MYAVIVAIGLVGLIGLSVSMGFSIATERVEKELKKREWEVWFREHEIIGLAEMTGCPCCALLRARADLQSAPPT